MIKILNEGSGDFRLDLNNKYGRFIKVASESGPRHKFIFVRWGETNHEIERSIIPLVREMAKHEDDGQRIFAGYVYDLSRIYFQFYDYKHLTLQEAISMIKEAISALDISLKPVNIELEEPCGTDIFSMSLQFD